MDKPLPSSSVEAWHQELEGISAAIPARICSRGKAALEMLMEAFAYAHDVERSLWDFALEITALRHAGLPDSDLRWLLCKGFLEQATEVPSGDRRTRSFQSGGILSFNAASCFVLTERGLEFASRSLEDGRNARHDRSLGLRGMAADNFHVVNPESYAESPEVRMKPFWDCDRQELRVGPQVVKQFKVPAPNQEIILAAFHEENWPVRIDDPLPPRPEMEPKRRLHDTINSLNRNQKAELIRFLGDGSGQGVRWEFVFSIDDAVGSFTDGQLCRD